MLHEIHCPTLVLSMFEINCPCGKTIPVRASLAGSTVLCSCGQTIDVPSLSNLRHSAEALDRPVQPRAKHDWRLWWRGFWLVIVGYFTQVVGYLIYSTAEVHTTLALGALIFIAGYVATLFGVFAVALGKGFALWFCLLLFFCIPFGLGLLVMLFVPGKGADKAP